MPVKESNFDYEDNNDMARTSTVSFVPTKTVVNNEKYKNRLIRNNGYYFGWKQQPQLSKSKNFKGYYNKHVTYITIFEKVISVSLEKNASDIDKRRWIVQESADKKRDYTRWKWYSQSPPQLKKTEFSKPSKLTEYLLRNLKMKTSRPKYKKKMTRPPKQPSARKQHQEKYRRRRVRREKHFWPFSRKRQHSVSRTKIQIFLGRRYWWARGTCSESCYTPILKTANRSALLKKLKPGDTCWKWEIVRKRRALL